MDARGVTTRTSKAVAFFRQDSSARYELHPHPWTRSLAPYYLVEGLDNSDGHGGYAAVCRFDGDRVPYTQTSQHRVYHPLVIARYVLRMCSIGALTGNQAAYAAALPAARALAWAGAATGIWRPARSVHAMSAKAPSCIIQATAISALVRVARHTPGVVPDDVIRRAVETLVAPASDGGTVTYSLGGPFFEEFDSQSHVLNGCVYALWAIYDAVDGLGWAELTSLGDSVESCLARVVPQFTTANGWSLYALDTYGYAPLASIDYHRSHIRMVTLLAERTGRADYLDAVVKWQDALDSLPVRLAILARKCGQVVWMRDVRRLPLAGSIWQ
jgi:hypothetical protein